MKTSPKNTPSRKLVSQALKSIPAWTGAGAQNDILLGVAARIIRNIPGVPFPGWSSAEDRQKVYETLSPLLLSNKALGINQLIEMNQLGLDERRILLERKYISPCMAARQDGCFVGCNKKYDCSVLINEEEHLVVRCYADGTDPEGSFQKFSNIAKSLDSSFSYAFDPKKGYLSSNPAEVGDGIQLYFFLHLPGLNLAGMIDQVTRGAEKLLVTLAPLHTSEENSGNCYVLGAGPARYGTTQMMFDHLLDVAQEIISREWELRYKLLYTKPDELLDVVGRSYGLLSYAHRLSYNELTRNLSHLRLGAMLDVLKPHGLPGNFHFCELLGEVLLELSPGTLADSGITDEEEQERSRAQTIIHMLNCSDIEFVSPLIDPEILHE